MFGVNKWTPQIWHCDPLIVVGEDGDIMYADRAEVEFEPSREGKNTGWARILNADAGPPIEIQVVSRMERMDKIPDIRLGMRSGFTLFGEDRSGKGDTWHVDGAADLFATIRAREEQVQTQTYGQVDVWDLDQRHLLFSGAATIERRSAESIESIEFLTLRPIGVQGPTLNVEVANSRILWPTFRRPTLGKIWVGVDSDGRSVEWQATTKPG